MEQYFVVGGIFKDINGHEQFDLVCQSSTELPHVMIDGVMDYFRLIWQNYHLDRLEADYSLSLVAPSPEALKCGIKAPERVTHNVALLEKLQNVICTHDSAVSGNCQLRRSN